MTPIQMAILKQYKQCTAEAGLHVNSVVAALRGTYSEYDIRNTVNWLMSEAYLYQTIDGDHAKSTE